jgi:hypothetical protein
MVRTLRLSVLYGLLPCTALTDWFCIIVVESVYCAVRTESLYKTEVSSVRVKGQMNHVIVQAVICRLLTAQARVKSESSAGGMYEVHNST